MKGCPLKCPWCHNPENLSKAPDLAFTPILCSLCGDCVAIPHRGGERPSESADTANCGSTGITNCGCHRVTPEGHFIDRAGCDGCGACAGACMPGALRVYGKEISAERAAALLLEDEDFYIQSGGGATLSGGEPLLQPEFCAAVLRILKARGVHTAADTCGDAPWSAFEAVLPYTDLFLYDIKHTDSAKLNARTGGDQERIAENLRKLAPRAPVELRIPVIPGFNDDASTLAAMGRLAASLPNITRVRLLAYHNMSRAKYEAIGMKCDMPETVPPSAEKMEQIKSALSGICANVCLSND